MSRHYRAIPLRSVLVLAILSALAVSVIPGGIAAAQQGPSVQVRPSGAFGMILTDPDGWTLYMWTGDEPGASSCYDACADAWPPYTLDWAPIPPPGFPGRLDLIDRGDGTWQVTLDDWPLYYFVRDNSPGDTNGHGSMGFGAAWHIISFGPAPSAAAPSGLPPAYGVQQLATPAQGALPAPLVGQPQAPAQPARPAPQGLIPPPGYSAAPGQPVPPGYAYPPQSQIAPGVIPAGYSQTLTIQGPPNGIVGLSWVATPAAASYRIYRTLSTQPLNLSVHQTIQQPPGQLATNALMTGLTPGATYYVQVRAVDHSGLETAVPASAYSSPSLGR